METAVPTMNGSSRRTSSDEAKANDKRRMKRVPAYATDGMKMNICLQK